MNFLLILLLFIYDCMNGELNKLQEKEGEILFFYIKCYHINFSSII